MKTDTKKGKKLSPVNVCSLALGCIIGWGAFVMPGSVFLPKAGPIGASIAVCLASLVMIIIAVNYSYMMNKYPVAGGECIYAQEMFGRKNAYLCGWFLGLSYLCIVPLNATALNLLVRGFFGERFQKGYLYHFANDDIYIGEIILCEVVVMVFAVITIVGVKISGIIQTILCFAIVAGILFILLAAGFSHSITAERLMPVFINENNKTFGIISVFAVMPWAFVGFDTIPQTTEEIGFSIKKTRALMVIAILFGAFVYIALTVVTAAVIPEGYASWNEYISNVKNLTGILSLPTFHAAYELLGDFGLAVIVIAVLGAVLSGVLGFYMAASRLLLALSKERFIPRIFCKIHPRFKTPVYAILFVCIISMAAPFLGRTALGWIVDMSSLGAAIGYGYTSAAALKLSLREKNKKILFTGISGMFFSLIFIVLLMIPVKSIGCSLSKQAYICLMIWGIIGLVFFMTKKENDQYGN